MNLYFPNSADNLTESFAYNPASQVVSKTRSNDLYAWTGHGNGSTSTVPNGLNQIASSGGAAFTYDANGNLTLDPSINNSYAYSSENLMTMASGSFSLAYDPMLRLSQVSGGTTVKFGYDGLDMVAEGDGAGAIQRRYVFADGIDEPVLWYEGSGTSDRRWLHADERGSVIAVTDQFGSAAWLNRYDEFGKPASGNVGRFQYTGQAWVPETNAYYYKARFYAPHLPRFMQPDPIGYAGGANIYVYPTDPVNLTDPLGLDCVAINGSSCPVVGAGEVTVWGSRGWGILNAAGSGRGGIGMMSFLYPYAFLTIDKEGSPAAPQNEHKGCAAPAVSPAERKAAQNGDRIGFWNSRAAAGDPLAGTALSIVNNSNFTGQFANVRLRDISLVVRRECRAPRSPRRSSRSGWS